MGLEISRNLKGHIGFRYTLQKEESVYFGESDIIKSIYLKKGI